MATKGSISDRFPKYKLFLFIAVLLALPITLWSLNNAPTNIEQQAQTSSCGSYGGGCYKYSCPSGYDTISGTCGLMADSACCRIKIAAPTGLTNVSSKCQRGTITNMINFSVKWGSVAKADKYYVYWYTKKSDGSTFSYDGKLVSDTNTSFSISTPHNVRLYWKVRGYNSTYKYYGTYSSSKEVPLSCK